MSTSNQTKEKKMTIILIDRRLRDAGMGDHTRVTRETKYEDMADSCAARMPKCSAAYMRLAAAQLLYRLDDAKLDTVIVEVTADEPSGIAARIKGMEDGKLVFEYTRRAQTLAGCTLSAIRTFKAA